MTQPSNSPDPHRHDLTVRRLAAAAGSAIFFVLAPIVVAGVVPWLLTDWRASNAFPARIALQPLGVLIVATGALVLVQAFVRFLIEGVGTPAPVAPTERLVIGGLYRHVRNPMYLAVIGIVIGQWLLLGRAVLIAYAATIALAMTAFVRGYEEPELERRFGEQYESYRREVRRWWPRVHACDPRNGRR
jgi:protein-S-isoprenylcysteine O-methyltransferase Ste14